MATINQYQVKLPEIMSGTIAPTFFCAGQTESYDPIETKTMAKLQLQEFVLTPDMAQVTNHFFNPDFTYCVFPMIIDQHGVQAVKLGQVESAKLILAAEGQRKLFPTPFDLVEVALPPGGDFQVVFWLLEVNVSRYSLTKAIKIFNTTVQQYITPEFIRSSQPEGNTDDQRFLKSLKSHLPQKISRELESHSLLTQVTFPSGCLNEANKCQWKEKTKEWKMSFRLRA